MCIRRLLCAVAIAALFLGSFDVSSAAAQNTETLPADFVAVYYFHGNFRCYACHTMEQYSKEAIEANFKDALSSGKLEFKVVNVEERGNEHFTQDYQLYTKSLVISLVKNGKEVKSKNLTKIWEYVRDTQRFYDYVKDEVATFLKEL